MFVNMEYVNETNSYTYLLKMKSEIDPKRRKNTQDIDISEKEHNYILFIPLNGLVYNTYFLEKQFDLLNKIYF